MNYNSSILFSYTVFICIFLLIASCTTQRLPASQNVTLIPLKNDTEQSGNYEVQVNYTGLKNDKYEFEVLIKNKSNDSIFVNPDFFTYSFISENDETEKNLIYSISQEERIKQLEIKKNNLKNEKNPYSLIDKNIGEIVTEGIVQGTVAFLFGQDPEKLEKQRREDEYEWEQKHNRKIDKINRELDYWNNSVLSPGTIPPQNEVFGKVLFPIYPDTKEIEIEIPLQSYVFEFRFRKSG